jgi:outer membrane receptor protein involved in Fe transport
MNPTQLAGTHRSFPKHLYKTRGSNRESQLDALRQPDDGQSRSVSIQLRYFSRQHIEKFGPEINVNGFGFFNRDFLLPSNLLWRRYEINDSLTMVRGSHQIKFGGQFLVHDNNVESHVFMQADSISVHCQAPWRIPHWAERQSPHCKRSTSEYRKLSAGIWRSQYVVNGTVLFVYIQDRWKALRTLTLDLGVRYELDDLQDPVRTDTNNLAPRLG